MAAKLCAFGLAARVRRILGVGVGVAVVDLDMLLFPHCDLHMTMDLTARNLKLRVMIRSWDDAGPAEVYTLRDVTGDPAVKFDFFAPHQPVGSRMDPAILPTVSSAGQVTPKAAGVFLFQVRFHNHYMVARLQVHPTMKSWWFGNTSITTTLSSAVGFAQPSIHAKFGLGGGADEIGDITGHGYVTLTSATPATISVTPEGRLHGHQVTPLDDSVDITGVGPAGTGPSITIPARCVDFEVNRPELKLVRGLADGKKAAERFNILYIPEGFTAAEEATFDEIVTRADQLLFDSVRHEPFHLLADRFSVWKAFFPSREPGVTQAFRSIGAPVRELAEGAAFPIEDFNASIDTGNFMVRDLTRIVGLPQAGESRSFADLVNLWSNTLKLKAPPGVCSGPADPLDPLDTSRITEEVTDKWKAQQVTGLFDARDSFFGYLQGGRPADRDSATGAMVPPALDALSDAMARYVLRLHEFYATRPSRGLDPDSRRNPPERYYHGMSKGMIGLVKGLLTQAGDPVGPQWLPGGRSVGMIVLVVNSVHRGGTNFGTITASTLGEDRDIGFTRDPANAARWHDPGAAVGPVSAQATSLTETNAHELAHSFNLLDEYEEFSGDACDALGDEDRTADNIAKIGFIFRNGTVNTTTHTVTLTDREIRPDRVKWIDLPRMELAARSTKASTAGGGGVQVTIPVAGIAAWTAAKAAGKKVILLAPSTDGDRQQLPLSTDPHLHATGLTIANVVEATGMITLTGGNLASPPGTFPADTGVLIQKLAPAPGLQPLTVVEEKVRQFLDSTHQPLNTVTDHSKIAKEPDLPLAIPNLNPPCKPYWLVGIYEGGATFAGGNFRPAGACKMRSTGKLLEGQFCHVCKWLLVNYIDPGQHAVLDTIYPVSS